MSLSDLTDDELIQYRKLFDEGMQKSKRFESRKIHATDLKFLYHLVRLSDECEQILSTGDLDLQRAREHMKAVRRGEISESDIREWFSAREKTLEKLYAESTLPHSPKESAIKVLLMNCLEEHYGNLENCVVNPNQALDALRQIQVVLDQNKNLF